MKIVGIDVYEYRLTYAHGEYAMSGARVSTHQTSTLVRVRTDEGVHGWGESCPLGANYLPMFPGGTQAALRYLAPLLVGLDPREVLAVQGVLDGALRGSYDAKSAIDLACWDILGKSLDVPVSLLLGGVLQQRFPLYEAVPLAPPAQMAEFITRRKAAGIDCFQVKVGNDPYDDAARARAAVEAADGSRVICDANGGWGLQQAMIAAREFDDLPVYLEQPCRTTEDCAHVRRVSTLPMVLDESITTPADLTRGVERAGAGSVNLKLSRLGGITPMRLLRDLAVSLGLTVSLEDTWGGDVVTAAVAHLAASTAASDLLSVSFFNTWTNEHVSTVPPAHDAGWGITPTGPGLGVDVDPTAIGAPLFVS
ncbi:mandelate racemase/muconate lactonizing enzyme family protein [Saccharopolyspora spinosa]|uniref:L-alanine-DL-glutamate epimerase-like enolase superfamily enzyme n=1 Tax=Saccharopolyspora spinosa TaxID=60894 RepID=A0A2N3Y116_SACSN|nr:mandelate racemase/muconate lactonizing enzyme family protein [Saccharopolyspora spinosa]PKW16609.1 L-alanine-DL-glutamate epimerase-like enolase superfamily enzyme [Saccharopolyspora spinosa]